MQKWEYMTLKVTVEQVTAVNGKDQPSEPLLKILRDQGKEGWELSGTLAYPCSEGVHYNYSEPTFILILKRPLP